MIKAIILSSFAIAVCFGSGNAQTICMNTTARNSVAYNNGITNAITDNVINNDYCISRGIPAQEISEVFMQRFSVNRLTLLMAKDVSTHNTNKATQEFGALLRHKVIKETSFMARGPHGMLCDFINTLLPSVYHLSLTSNGLRLARYLHRR